MGEVYHALFQELEKSVLIFGKNAQTVINYGLNSSFKMQFLIKSFQEKKPLIFLCGAFFSRLFMIVYQSALIPRKLPCPKKFLDVHLNVATLKHNVIIIYSKNFSTHIFLLNPVK